MEGAINEPDFNDNDALGRELHRLEMRSASVDINSGFPATTNQEHHSNEVNDRQHHGNIDKGNFKTKNPFMAYVDSSFNSGVFTHPWRDMY